MDHHPSDTDNPGFSLIELLVIMTILGVLATIVVMTITGYRDDAEDSACPADWRNLNTAIEAYFVQFDTTTIPLTGAAPQGYETTLRSGGILRVGSELYDLDSAGNIMPEAGSPCT